MMSELVFYTNPQSRGRMVRWMLEEVGADYATEILAYGATMKSPEYLAINPMGKVPAIRHGETIVTECAAIIAYLADAFPDAGLAPPLEDRGAYYRWLFFAAGPLEAAIVNRSLGFEVPAEKEMMAGYGNFERTLDTLETALSGTPYVAGDAFTAADVYLGAHVAWGMQFGSIPARPAFESYARRVTERDACRRAAELDDAASE
ncbi:MAG: glutathione S-transferase family protein [Gammaproteobacteria bacterium]|jgi:glutathione S-transferase